MKTAPPGWVPFLCLLIALATIVPAPVQAKDTIKQPEFLPVSPRIMAQGGTRAVVPAGYESLFTNPAGFAWVEEPTVTLPSTTVWAHSRPDLLLSTIGAFGADETIDDDDGDPVLDVLKEQFTTNGFGLGASLGIGFVGYGVGLGLNVSSNSYLYGDTFPLGVEGELQQQMTLTIGYGHPFEVGPVSIGVGGALRPTLRVFSLLDSDSAVDVLSTFFDVSSESMDGNGDDNGDDLLENLTALSGWGVGFDGGVLVGYRAFTLGVQARNLFNTNMEYTRNSLADIVEALGSGGLPSATQDKDSDSYVAETYILPMEFSFGLAWEPDLGDTASIFSPRIHVQLTDPFMLTDQDPDRPRSFWTRLHTGTELTFLNFFDLRMGINQGYVTTGFGVDLGFLDVNFALFSEEYGRYPGDRQVSTAALEFALRF